MKFSSITYVCLVVVATSTTLAQKCCPAYSQVACDHNDGYFFSATCCSDGLWYCQARGMMGSVCKFSSPGGTGGKACQPWAAGKCAADDSACIRFVVGKAANGTLSSKNYEDTVMVDQRGRLMMGSEAVAFEWYKDNYLRNIFDGRCLSAVSANKVDFVSCSSASRWETMVSAADNGRFPDKPVVIVRQINNKDKPTGQCIARVGSTLRTKKCADAFEQQFVLAPQTAFGGRNL